MTIWNSEVRCTKGTTSGTYPVDSFVYVKGAVRFRLGITIGAWYVQSEPMEIS